MGNLKRLCAGGEWTVAKFWSFLRSNLRLASRKWPPLARLALQLVRRESESSNARLRWEYQCAECLSWNARKAVQVDHIEPVGQLLCHEDLPGFVLRLFCETEGLRVVCKRCHHAKTHAKK